MRSNPDQSRGSRGIFLGAFISIAIAVAVWLGVFGFGGDSQDSELRQASPAGAPSDVDDLDKPTENIAAAGRVRVPGEGGAETAELWKDFNKAGSGSRATVLDAPPSADAAALEIEGTGSIRGALAEVGDGSETDPNRPRFDVIRVAPDGSAVLAGRAVPGAIVQVLVDGAPSETIKVDRTGEFVALLDAPTQPQPKGGARRIDLSAKNPDGAVIASSTPIIVTMPSRPDEKPVAVRPNRGGYEVLQPATSAEEGQVSVDAVTYGEKGEVVVTGRGAPGQTARVYLDNQLKAEAKVGAGGDWRAEIGDEVAPARYNLRVDQTSKQGVVTGRAETPFERARPADIKISEGTVIVQPGNNLWRIADYVYGDGARYTVIYGQNKTQIRNPDLIYPGQVLDLPKGG